MSSELETNSGAPRASERALRELYERHAAELARFARRLLGSGPPEPDDVVQEAFAAFAAVEGSEQVQNPRAYLYRIAGNLIINLRRARARDERRLANEKIRRDIFGDYDELSPEIVLLDRERFQTIAAAVRGLPRRQRRFLLLHRLEGAGYSEIARASGVSESTVRREVEAAVRALGAALTRTGNEE